MAEQAPVAQVAPDGDVSATDGGSVFFFSCSKRIWAEMLMWQIVVIMRCRWDLKVNLHHWWPHFSQELESCQDYVLDITILLLFINHLSESVSCKL